jgi:hypothetical protein
MKKIVPLFITLTAIQFGFAQSDDQDVKQVINSAYVGGIHNGGPIDDIRKGFHPAFIMFRQSENDVKQTTIDEWVKSLEAARAKDSNPNPVKASARFTSVAIVGSSANVTLDLYRGERKIFTDHLLLYKFTEGWRIVGKSFYRHP